MAVKINFFEPMVECDTFTLLNDNYQPTHLTDIIGQEQAINLIGSFTSSYMPNIILSGPNGTGKLSIAQIIADSYFPLPEHRKNAVLMIDGSIFRSKNIISEAPTKKTSEKGTEVPNIIFFIKKSLNIPKDKQKLVIINDFDCMVEDAQAGLRRIIEKYSARVRFIFICHHISNIIEAIQSRSVNIKLMPISHSDIIDRLKAINEDHGYESLTDNIYDHIATIANGDLRCAINMLQLFNGSQDRNEHDFYQIFNMPSLLMTTNIINLCKKSKYIEACTVLSNIIDNGYNIYDILDIIIKVLSKPDTFTKKEEHLRLRYIDKTIRCIMLTKNSESYIHLYALLAHWQGQGQ